jgi:hypothetical protein
MVYVVPFMDQKGRKGSIGLKLTQASQLKASGEARQGRADYVLRCIDLHKG